MRALIILSLLAIHSLSCCQAQTKKPKLVVGIVIDQMKQEYLYRFQEKYEEGGFNRIINEGFMSKNAHYNYIPTKTAAGHASIYTGTTPRYHGIIGNDWYSKVLKRNTYCVGDTLAVGVGTESNAGKMSPRNLQVTTITDELKLTSNFRSKVIGVSIKDRGSILPAGHTPDGAYWYESNTGNFITSDYYLDELPQWVSDFNDKKMVNKYLDQTWNLSYPKDEYVESTKDDTEYERIWKGKESPTFPYNLEEIRKKNSPYGLISQTPFGNSLVLDFARDAIKSNEMGKDKIVDFIAVSLSSTDYIGHGFAPNSIEIEDTYIKLDKDLSKFLTFLDQEIGKGEYILFITADHGVVANPQFLMDNKLPGGYMSPKELRNGIQNSLSAQLGEGEWISSISNEQVFLNQDLIIQSEKNKEDVENMVSEILYSMEGIYEVYTTSELKNISSADHLGILLSNGRNKKLSGDVLFTMKPGYLFGDYGSKGTTHGSGHTYDTHIPILFFGSGIKQGKTSRYISIIDIAPTLSSLLNISLPSACTGQPITELFE
ncbi:MAG: alkaline phosphatase family protein [Cyclobacteriaceae bacterium]